MGVLSILSQEMTNEQLVVRHHIDDLNTKSQLIVYESQEALFFRDGQALDLFPSGRHTLTTENVPIIKKIFGSLFGGKTPFPCDIVYINKVNVLDFLWGTDSPIELADPKYSMIVGVRANGQTGIRIRDSRMFAIKVVGMLREYTTDELRKTVKSMIMSSIKECIASTIIDKGVSILEITPRLTEIGDAIKGKLNGRIADLGLEIVHFNLNGVLASDGDLDTLKKAKNEMLSGMNVANIEAYKMQVLSEARAKARATEGYTYADERRFDVLETAAANEGAGGGFINMGVGMGVGLGVGREVGNMTGEMLNPPNPAPAPTPTEGTVICTGCGQPMPENAKFCPNCGQPKPQSKFCTQCGAKLAPGVKFCPECGTKQ